MAVCTLGGTQANSQFNWHVVDGIALNERFCVGCQRVERHDQIATPRHVAIKLNDVASSLADARPVGIRPRLEVVAQLAGEVLRFTGSDTQVSYVAQSLRQTRHVAVGGVDLKASGSCRTDVFGCDAEVIAVDLDVLAQVFAGATVEHGTADDIGASGVQRLLQRVHHGLVCAAQNLSGGPVEGWFPCALELSACGQLAERRICQACDVGVVVCGVVEGLALGIDANFHAACDALNGLCGSARNTCCGHVARRTATSATSATIGDINDLGMGAITHVFPSFCNAMLCFDEIGHVCVPQRNFGKLRIFAAITPRLCFAAIVDTRASNMAWCMGAPAKSENVWFGIRLSDAIAPWAMSCMYCVA